MSQPAVSPDPKVLAAEIERQLKQLALELNSKFARLVRGLKTPKDLKYLAPWKKEGRKELPSTAPNSRGTDRFAFEVDFAHVQDEFDRGPIYLRPKLIDRMSGIIANLITKLKEQREESATPEASS